MKKTLSLFMAAVMLLLLPANMLASGIFGAQNEPTRVKQLDELRESNSDTYLLSDGSYECVVYAADKYYKDDSGKYVEIDHSIVRAQSLRFGKSYAYKNAAGDASAYFADNEPRVCVEMNGSSLSFSLSGANRTSARAGEASAKRSVHEYELFGKNYISYENVLNGTDLIYEMLNGCLKEYVLLKDRSAPSEYTFIFDAPELAARKTENGTVEFINAVDEPVFELGALFAVDSNGEYTDALEYTVRETGQKGRYEITVSVSKDYLNAPERAFPVLVDPTVNIYGASLTYDSFVSETNAATNYQMDQHLRTGKDAPYGVRRTYIKFVLPSDITGATISDAYIRIKKKSGTPPTAKVCRVTGNWNSATINWFKKPGYTAFNSGALALVSNDWYKATVTAIVQEWASGTSNYGFIIKDNTENNVDHWTTFYSSDAGYPNRPELHIVYTAASNGIVLDNNVTQLNPGATTYIRVKSYFPSTDTLKWTSSNSRVASINETTGGVTANACGKVTITVSLVQHPSVSASMVLTVNPPTTPTSGVDSDCVYMIKNTNNDKYLAATGSGVKLADKNDMDGRQLWYAKWTGSGYKLYSMGHKDTASAGQYESLLRGSTKYTTPGFGNEYAADLTWSIHRYNVYYWYITNTSDKYRNTSLSANASNDTVSCIPLADETTYARWEFEKIETPTFNNYWTGGYIGHQSGTIHIKINLDDSLFSHNGQSTGISRELFNVLNRSSNPWSSQTDRIVIHGPNDTDAPNNAFQITYKGDATLPSITAGRTHGRNNANQDLSTGADWNKVCILLNTSGTWKSFNDIHKEKTILHELGHALKLAHPFHSTADVPNGRPSYPDNVYGCNDVCAIMNWRSPTVNSTEINF